MSYLNEDGLVRYDGLFKNWVTFKSGTVDGIDSLLNWQKTENVASVTFYPLPAAPIDPVVTFAFTEISPAEGTKGPDNPSTITGVSSITVTKCETEGIDETQYTVDLDSTYYGGNVNLSTGVMTVTISFSEISSLSSVVSVKTNTVCFNSKLSDSHPNGSGYSWSCQEFENGNASNASVDVECCRPWGSSTGFYINILKSRLNVSDAVDPSNPTDAEWLAAGNAWIVNHHVSVVSALATPQTVQFTPTQIYSLSQVDEYTPRLNTIYSNQTSVQVGYPKSPIQTESELRQMLNT